MHTRLLLPVNSCFVNHMFEIVDYNNLEVIVVVVMGGENHMD